MSPDVIISPSKKEGKFPTTTIRISPEKARLIAADLTGAMALLNDHLGHEKKERELAAALAEAAMKA